MFYLSFVIYSLIFHLFFLLPRCSSALSSLITHCLSVRSSIEFLVIVPWRKVAFLIMCSSVQSIFSSPYFPPSNYSTQLCYPAHHSTRNLFIVLTTVFSCLLVLLLAMVRIFLIHSWFLSGIS